MFPVRYFCNDYLAPRYWPKVGATPPTPTDDMSASFFGQVPEHIRRHHFPPAGSHIGAMHHHALTLLRGLKPAGV